MGIFLATAGVLFLPLLKMTITYLHNLGGYTYINAYMRTNTI